MRPRRSKLTFISLVVLANLHGKGNQEDPKVLAEFQEIKEAVRFEREQAVSSYAALMAASVRKRVILGMSIQAWSQLCGMNIMMYVFLSFPSSETNRS
jgi:Sugar (and other) transporter